MLKGLATRAAAACRRRPADCAGAVLAGAMLAAAGSSTEDGLALVSLGAALVAGGVPALALSTLTGASR